MKFKKAICAILAGTVAAAALPTMVGCSGNDKLGGAMYDYGEEYYKSVSSRHKLNYDEMLYDDFTNGIDLDRWVISDSVWDQWSTDQNGVRPQNVFLVDDENNPDTHLLLRANGSYYNMDNDPLYTEEEKATYGNDGKTLFNASQGYGLNTGACISTTEALGPGRYDIKMKACPRVGALTSMWVYSWFTLNDGSTQQNEIDIEIGLKPDFSQVFFTTWTAPSNNTNMPTPVDYYVNDGDWHIYSFDWVTDVDVPYVDYYIDGVKVLTIDANVPTTNATLNIGLWVPSWAGGGATDPENGNMSADSRMYDTDYAEISWWRYVPFQMEGWEQRPVQNRNFAEGYEPKKLTTLPTAEKCANGDFERDDYGYYGNPWKDFTVTDEALEAFVPNSSAGLFTETINDVTNTCAKIVNGGLLGQWLRGASTGFKYRLTGKYRTEGEAKAAFRYTYVLGYSTTSRTNGNKTVDIGSSDEWKDFTLDFTIDKDEVQSIRYYLLNSQKSGTCYFDDLSLIYLGH
ncbi:MAG: glycoside hydrolase family 16 protein [Clostridiales bacterium]|nr:glycoside hydrolase family 16 protein [Clostridiales bacterium]